MFCVHHAILINIMTGCLICFSCSLCRCLLFPVNEVRAVLYYMSPPSAVQQLQGNFSEVRKELLTVVLEIVEPFNCLTLDKVKTQQHSIYAKLVYIKNESAKIGLQLSATYNLHHLKTRASVKFELSKSNLM